MKVEKNAFVAISYDLFDVIDGKDELVHQVSPEQPETMVFGVTPYVLEPLAQAIDGLGKGDSFTVILPPDKGFGEYRDDMLRTESVPRAVFEEDGKLDEKKIFPGAKIYLQTNVGQEVAAVVLAVTDEFVEVKVDFNHPLAGHTVKISGHIDEVRPASEAEIAAAAAVGHCGCGDGCSCEGGCGGCGCN